MHSSFRIFCYLLLLSLGECSLRGRDGRDLSVLHEKDEKDFYYYSPLFGDSPEARRLAAVVRKKALKDLERDYSTFQNLPLELRNDKSVILAVLPAYPKALKYVSDQILNDREFIIQCVQLNGLALEVLEQRYKDDEIVVLQALVSNLKATKFAGNILRTWRTFGFSTVDIKLLKIRRYMLEVYQSIFISVLRVAYTSGSSMFYKIYLIWEMFMTYVYPTYSLEKYT